MVRFQSITKEGLRIITQDFTIWRLELKITFGHLGDRLCGLYNDPYPNLEIGFHDVLDLCSKNFFRKFPLHPRHEVHFYWQARVN